MGELRFEIILTALVLGQVAVWCLPTRCRKLLRFLGIVPGVVLRIIFWPPSRTRYERGLRGC